VRVAAGRIEVEDLAGGTLVNGHPITGRIEAEYPASVQVGELTLVVEQKGEDPSQAATMVQSPRQGSAPLDDLEVTVVTPRAVRQPAGVASGQSYADHNGRYALVKEIARGGMGQIYFGEDPQLERQVAVKVSSISEGGEDQRFTKEAKVLALLAHPNIVPIHTMGVDSQGRPFYSMKLVKGRTLQAVLNALKDGNTAATKEYTQAALLTVFRKVSDAMAFAHAKGILHRDLKPENIMVGEYGEVLVMDWGLAKILGERDAMGAVKAAATDTGDYGMTLEGEVMGTPQYMSPEQAEGMVAELDTRSDIYSLGGILYAILTLRPPVGGSTLAEVLGNVKSGVLSPMGTATRMAKGIGGRPEPMTVAAPPRATGGNTQGHGHRPHQALRQRGVVCGGHRVLPERVCHDCGRCGCMEACEAVAGAEQGAGGSHCSVIGCREWIHSAGCAERARGQ
jgi:predicted Ser/Thr protein kinase